MLILRFISYVLLSLLFGVVLTALLFFAGCMMALLTIVSPFRLLFDIDDIFPHWRTEFPLAYMERLINEKEGKDDEGCTASGTDDLT